MVKPKKEVALSDAQRAMLIDVVDELSESLSKAPDEMNKIINSRLYQFNRIFLETAMNTSVLSTQDKNLLIKIRDVIEKSIHPLLETNNFNKEQLKEQSKVAIKELNDVKKDIQEPQTSPRFGKSS